MKARPSDSSPGAGPTSPVEEDRLLFEEDGVVVKSGNSEIAAVTEDDAFPTMPMIAVTVIVACDNVAFTVVFPFLGYLIIFLGLVHEEVEVRVVLSRVVAARQRSRWNSCWTFNQYFIGRSGVGMGAAIGMWLANRWCAAPFLAGPGGSVRGLHRRNVQPGTVYLCAMLGLGL